MSTQYVTKPMKDGRLQLTKPYNNGVSIKNWPKLEGGWEVHINWPYSLGLNEEQMKFINSNGLKATRSFRWYQIRFSEKRIIENSSEMFSTMEALKPVVSILKSLENSKNNRIFVNS